MNKLLPLEKTPVLHSANKVVDEGNYSKVMIVGLGVQTRKDHIPSILRRKDLSIVALVDQDQNILKEYGNKLGIKTFNDVDAALVETSPDVAVVSLPHDQYFSVLKTLAMNKIPTLKEKPFAMTYDDASELIKLYKFHDTYLQICVQRRFSKLYETTKDLLATLGHIYSVNVEYSLNLKEEDMVSGWRADRKISGGGAALDMGYHSIDLLTYIFGSPDKVYAQLSYNSLGIGYSIEDTMKALMTYSDRSINANIIVTKISNHKSETVKIFGSEGFVVVDGRTVSLYDKNSDEIESHSFNSKQHEVDSQLDYFLSKSLKDGGLDTKDQNFIDQLNNMRIIDAIYASHAADKIVKLR